MIVWIILALLFLLILGTIILIILAIKNNKNSIYVSFQLKKDNWEFELNKQLLLETFEENTGYIKNLIIQKIKLISNIK